MGFKYKTEEERKEALRINRLKAAMKYSHAHPDRIRLQREKQRDRHNERRRSDKYKRKRAISRSLRYKNDPVYRMKANARSRVLNVLRSKGMHKVKSTQAMLGCTSLFLKEHIENQFLPGMSWDNMSYSGWHIDHIIPISLAKTHEEIISLSHYTNLRPLWAKDNFKKSNKVCQPSLER